MNRVWDTSQITSLRYFFLCLGFFESSLATKRKKLTPQCTTQMLAMNEENARDQKGTGLYRRKSSADLSENEGSPREQPSPKSDDREGSGAPAFAEEPSSGSGSKTKAVDLSQMLRGIVLDEEIIASEFTN